MKKIKKRLSALLLALAVALMPLSMAVPASASSDVLSGPVSSGWEVVYNSTPFVVPALEIDGIDALDCFPFYFYRALSESTVGFYGFSSEPLSFEYVDSSSNWVYFYFPPDTTCTFYFFLDGVWNSTGSGSVDAENVLGYPYWPCYSIYDSDPFTDPVFVRDESSSGIGVFSVFSGVGSWTAGAVNEMFSMFWTAEGGLSVLGVLAVASLSISFILMLIWLIAGWLKFK